MFINPVFEYTRADKVAETWDGVSQSLRSALWSKIVPHMKPIPNLEDSGPADHVGHENLASHWKRLSFDERNELNRLAAKRDAEFQEWREKV